MYGHLARTAAEGAPGSEHGCAQHAVRTGENHRVAAIGLRREQIARRDKVAHIGLLDKTEFPRRTLDGGLAEIDGYNFPVAEQFGVFLHEEHHPRHPDCQSEGGVDDIAVDEAVDRIDQQARRHVERHDARRHLVDIAHDALVSARQRRGAFRTEQAVNHRHVALQVGHRELEACDFHEVDVGTFLAQAVAYGGAVGGGTVAADVEQVNRRAVALQGKVARHRQRIGAVEVRPREHHQPVAGDKGGYYFYGQSLTHHVDELAHGDALFAEGVLAYGVYFVG